MAWSQCALTRAIVVVIAAAGMCAVTVHGQRQIFKAGTEIITLEVRVTGPDGLPVTGLKASDFQLTEEGKPQSIVAFTEVSVPVVTWPAPWMNIARHDVATNEPASGRLLTFIIDDAMMGAQPDVPQRIKDVVLRLIEDVAPNDRVAVVFTRDSRSAQPLTSDRQRLRQTLERIGPGLAGVAANTTGPGAGGFRAVLELAEGQMTSTAALRTISDAVSVLATTEHVPKAIVYIGLGAEIDWNTVSRPILAGSIGATALRDLQVDHARALRGIFDRAARANIAVHAIDAAGLRSPGRAMTGSAEFVQNLAVETGGVAAVYTNDYAAALGRISQVTRHSYVLGYTPESRGAGYHRVMVRVDRPGVTVRYASQRERAAFDAPEPAPGASPEQLAIAGLLPDPGLPLRIALTAVPVSARGKAVIAGVLLVRQPTDGRRRLERLDVRMSAFDMEGRFKAGARGTAEVRMKDTPHEEARYEVYSRLDLSPGRYQVRVSFRDPIRNQTGSIYTDIDVPDFSKGGLHLSAPIVDAGPTRLVASPATLFADLLPVQPTAERAFPRGTGLEVFARLLHGGRPDADVVVTTRIVDERGKDMRRTETTVPASRLATQRPVDLRIAVPTLELPPGWYLLEIAATGSRGDARVQHVTFQVTDPSARQ